jgi:hypothetical protein
MHPTSNVMCPSSSSGIVAIPEFYEIPRQAARRFEVEDLARRIQRNVSSDFGAVKCYRIATAMRNLREVY